MRMAIVPILAATFLSGCCGMGPEYATAPTYGPPPAAMPVPVAAYANPVFLPVADPNCLWEQLVDTLDDYFRIEHETPVRMAGNVPTEGSVTTVPQISPTIFEPWRHDTVDSDQRLENTLQSIRRRAAVRVTPAPAQGGYWVDVQVFKELEDNKHPEHATAGAATLRYDTSLTRVENPVTGDLTTQGWIGRGRDATLEQQIIGDLLSRCGPAPTVVRGQLK